MSKTRIPALQIRSREQHQQLSLPLPATNQPPVIGIEAQRAATLAMLSQMLIEAVQTEARTVVTNDDKEINDER